MIITLKKNTPNQEVDHLIQQFESQNLKVSLGDTVRIITTHNTPKIFSFCARPH